VPHSCGHRHCPHCQHHESQQWLERQLQKQVPAEYFLLTFTLPAEFRGLARAHQNVIYDLLMRCSWETVRTFSQNDKQLQGTPGAIAVLHTNTRQLDYHPHVHLVMPAAAVNGKQKKWRIKRRGTGKGTGKGKSVYLFNEKAMAKVFRAKFLAGMACVAERISAGTQFWLSTFQLQAPDRFAACGVEVQSGPGIGLDQGAGTYSVYVLRGGDEDRANADSIFVLGTHADSYCRSRCMLIM
jgi:hypothetical protein